MNVLSSLLLLGDLVGGSSLETLPARCINSHMNDIRSVKPRNWYIEAEGVDLKLNMKYDSPSPSCSLCFCLTKTQTFGSPRRGLSIDFYCFYIELMVFSQL